MNSLSGIPMCTLKLSQTKNCMIHLNLNVIECDCSSGYSKMISLVTLFSFIGPVLFPSITAFGEACFAGEEESVFTIIDELAETYEVPEWFLLAIVHRESSFDADDISMDDGIGGTGNWDAYNAECAFTTDGYPHGLGLTKLTGWMYQGSPYPYCLEEQDDSNEKYYYSMAKQNFGDWISMSDVSVLTDPFDPRQNVERFLTGYAVPANALFQSLYPEETEEEIWRSVAFHWNKGLYEEYDPDNTDYLGLYDEYVELYY